MMMIRMMKLSMTVMSVVAKLTFQKSDLNQSKAFCSICIILKHSFDHGSLLGTGEKT